MTNVVPCVNTALPKGTQLSSTVIEISEKDNNQHHMEVEIVRPIDGEYPVIQVQCVWLILSRRFASRPEPPTRLAPSQALAVLAVWELFRSFSYFAVMANK